MASPELNWYKGSVHQVLWFQTEPELALQEAELYFFEPNPTKLLLLLIIMTGEQKTRIHQLRTAITLHIIRSSFSNFNSLFIGNIPYLLIT